MLKFVHLYKNYYLGFSMIGLIAFILQEIPYMVMPLIQPESNPIMNMQNEIHWIEMVQSVLGVLSMVVLMLIVRDDTSVFLIETTKEKLFFTAIILMLMINYVGWIFYYLGHQYAWLIVVSQFAAVPLYYLFFGLWKNNYLLVGTASLFFVIHTLNGYLNFITR